MIDQQDAMTLGGGLGVAGLIYKGLPAFCKWLFNRFDTDYANQQKDRSDQIATLNLWIARLDKQIESLEKALERCERRHDEEQKLRMEERARYEAMAVKLEMLEKQQARVITGSQADLITTRAIVQTLKNHPEELPLDKKEET